jgi:D-alanyl-D-alanine carboxypeptidase
MRKFGFAFITFLLCISARAQQDSAPLHTPLNASFGAYSCDTAVALRVLREEISSLLPATRYRYMIPACKVVLYNPDNSLIPIHDVNSELTVLPASVEKLFTTSTILWALGPKYEFRTRLDILPGSRVEGNSVIGNVYLHPSGDPTLTISDFDSIAFRLKAQGITQIEGDVISDLTSEDILSTDAKKYFAEEYKLMGSASGLDSILTEVDATSAQTAEGGQDDSDIDEEPTDEESLPGYFSQYPNFFIDRNVVTVRVAAGQKKGAHATASIYPPIPGIRLINRAGTSAPVTTKKYRVKRGKGKHAKWKTVTRHSKGVYSLRVTSSQGASDLEQVITITGLLPARYCRNYNIPLHNVPLAMAGLLKWRLEANGIRVTGTSRTGKMKNPNSQLRTISEKSMPLLDLLAQTNKRSDNYLAESMFRKLSSVADVPASGNTYRGKKMIESWMNVLGMHDPKVSFADGSGLSHDNHETANNVIGLLQGIRNRPEMYNDFVSTLSVAGVDGTTRGRMIGTLAEGNAHSKTGTLNSVTALAGYVSTKDGQLASYFITMQNTGRSIKRYKAIQDAIVSKLASFSYKEYLQKYAPEKLPEPVTAPGTNRQ